MRGNSAERASQTRPLRLPSQRLFQRHTTMNPALPIIADCQRILAAHLPPDGISERACISALLGVLDNPETVALTANLNAVPPVSPSVSVAVAEVRAACHDPVAVLMQRLENQKGVIESLQHQLERVRPSDRQAELCAIAKEVGVVLGLVEAGGASPELTQAVVKLGEIKGALEWQSGAPYETPGDGFKISSPGIFETPAILSERVEQLTAELNEEHARQKRFQDQLTDRDQRLAAYANREAAADQRMEELSGKNSSLQRRLHFAEEKLKSIAFAMAEVN